MLGFNSNTIGFEKVYDSNFKGGGTHTHNFQNPRRNMKSSSSAAGGDTHDPASLFYQGQ